MQFGVLNVVFVLLITFKLVHEIINRVLILPILS